MELRNALGDAGAEGHTKRSRMRHHQPCHGNASTDTTQDVHGRHNTSIRQLVIRRKQRLFVLVSAFLYACVCSCLPGRERACVQRLACC